MPTKFFASIGIATILTLCGSAAYADAWQGVFTKAYQHDGIWTASVFDHSAGRQITKDFKECRRVVEPIHGWACRNEILNFVFAGSQSDDDEPISADVQTGDDGHLFTSKRPSDADVASVPKGWSGIYKSATRGRSSWTATRYDGKSDGPFSTCTTMNGSVICQ